MVILSPKDRAMPCVLLRIRTCPVIVPPSVRSITIVATDLVPNKFNELVKPSQWQHIREALRPLKSLETFSLTFAGMDDFRLSRPARASFGESFNVALKQREAPFAESKVAVAFRFVADPEQLTR